MIETLTHADRPEVVEVLGEAFRSHPMVPPDPRGKLEGWGARLMMRTMLDAFDRAPDAQLFGVRRDGRLACVAFVHAYGYDPSGLVIARMFWNMARVMGLRMLLQCMRVMGEKHPGDDPRLELLILGTRVTCQGQGLGRAVMRHVYDYARQHGHAAVTLEVAHDSPARGFYEREGFRLEKQVPLAGETLSYMRRDLS